MKYHELANVFPMMSASESEGLVEDIKENGLREPIWTFEGKILDGRNRFQACQKAGVEPRFQNYDGADPIGFVISLNIHRRHLEKSQLGVIALDFEKIEAARAKERMSIGGKGVEKIPHLAEGKARDKAAAAVGVNARYVSDAKKIEKQAPELLPEIRSGDLTIPKAIKQINKKDRIEKINAIADASITAERPSGLFNVIVIDPPWRYDGGEQAHDSEGFRGVVDYPTMSLNEIASLEIPSSDDCVLWFWTTHRFMRHALEMLSTWGFEEKAILTWVKDRMGIGRWLRSQSEFCIMAVKGKPPVNLTNQTTILTAPLREHSRKPDEFYEMVEALCVGRRLDFFSRQVRAGWEQFGNDADRFE